MSEKFLLNGKSFLKDFLPFTYFSSLLVMLCITDKAYSVFSNSFK